VILQNQRAHLAELINSFRSKYQGLFISVPGDEEKFGGCLSAGRGFVHISAGGNLEPCPFIPYSDTNLHKIPLRGALQSDFIKKLRLSKHPVKTNGGCTLPGKEDWIRSLLNAEHQENAQTLRGTF
jgi:MoaA/NifB/PqqE/SkfB family radical SAM enzyme